MFILVCFFFFTPWKINFAITNWIYFIHFMHIKLKFAFKLNRLFSYYKEKFILITKKENNIQKDKSALHF